MAMAALPSAAMAGDPPAFRTAAGPNGRADATMYQYGVAAYVTKTSPQASGLQVLSFKEYGIGYNAMPFLKSEKAVLDATPKAITELKADGAYGKILGVWGMEANSLEKITVNDGLKYNQPSTESCLPKNQPVARHNASSRWCRAMDAEPVQRPMTAWPAERERASPVAAACRAPM
jgi:hypothetical protein